MVGRVEPDSTTAPLAIRSHRNYLYQGGHIGALIVFKKPNKYFNQPTEVNGTNFDSKSEAKRYLELEFLLKHKMITDLELQPSFPLHCKTGEVICHYVADFRYRAEGKDIVEDVKGFKTPVYKLKKKWFQAEYKNLTFLESEM